MVGCCMQMIFAVSERSGGATSDVGRGGEVEV